MSSSSIIASSYYVPDRTLSHEELSQRYGTEHMDKVAASSGIYERRVAGDEECASDLAYRAASDLLTSFDIDRKTIDMIIFATQTPDYLLPTTACILQDRLELPTHCAAFDVNLGCSQYIYGLSVAHAYIASGLRKRVLMLTGDTVSRIIHPEDNVVVPLFGDAATATLLEMTPNGQGFQGFEFGTDGSGHQHLIWPTSGMRVQKSQETAKLIEEKSGAKRTNDHMKMDGAKIFIFTIKTIPTMIHNALEKANCSLEDIDLFVFHQASQMIVETAARKLKIPNEKLHYKLHDVGNSGGSTVGITLTDAWLGGKLGPGKKVLLASFGVGLSWAATVIVWPESTLGPVCTVDFSKSPTKPESQQT